MSTDNDKIDVRLELEHLPAMLDLALSLAPGGNANSYAIHPDYGLILLWHHHDIVKGIQSQAFPPIPVKDFVTSWVKNAKPEDFPSKDKWDKFYDDGDVSCRVGFRMYNEDWGHVAGSHYGIVAIRPVYMWYGK